MFGDKITQSVSEAVKKVLATEKLHPNQQKLDVHEPEKDKLTKKDFEMLRSNKKPKNEAFDPLKHVKNPSPAVKTAAKDVKRGSYADRAALMKAGGVKDDRGPRGVTQEEVEQIDELSTKTLAKAAGAASDPDSDYSYGKSHDPQKFADHAKKTKDAKSAAAVQGAADAKGHYPRDNRTQGYDKLANRTPARVTAAGKANRQDVNKLKGNIKRNEEVGDVAEQTSYNPDGSVSFTGQHSSKDPGFSQNVANFNARKLAATTLRGPNGGQVPPHSSAGDEYKPNGEKMDVSSTIKIQKKDLPPGGAVQTRYSEAVESPFTSYKKPREIESRGGSGIKLGSRYGGGKQKDEPTQDEAPKTKKPKGMKNFKEMFGE